MNRTRIFIGALLLVIVGMVIGTIFTSSQRTTRAEDQHDPNQTQQGWEPIPEGDLVASERMAIVVREVDFRNADNPQVFFYGRWLEVGQSLKFGRDTVQVGANRDGWQKVNATIEEALLAARDLALVDAKGNIPNATVWLQLECADVQVEQAKLDGLTVQQLGDNWFVQVPASRLADKYAVLCDMPAPTVTPTLAPPTATPPPTAVTDCDVVRPVKPGTQVPQGTLVVYEVVDFSAKTITVEAKVLDINTIAGANGQVHTNMWTGYCSDQAAEEAAFGQADERTSESQIPGSWAEGMEVTLR